MPPRIYTQEPIKCVVEDVGWVPIWVTPRNPSTAVTCILTPLEGVLTNVPVIAVERPDYPDLVIVYANCSGRLELSSTSSTVFWTIVVSVWRCIMGVIKVTGTLVSGEASTTALFTVAKVPRYDNCRVTYTTLNKEEKQRFYTTWTIAVTDQIMYLTMVANNITLDNIYKLYINTIARLSYIVPVYVQTIGSFLGLFPRFIQLHVKSNSLQNKSMQLLINVKSNIQRIFAILDVNTKLIANTTFYTINVITSGISNITFYTVNIFITGISNTVFYTINVITSGISNSAFYTINVITSGISNSVFYTMNIITKLTSIVESHLFKLRVAPMPIALNNVISNITILIHRVQDKVKKVLFTSALTNIKKYTVKFNTLSTLIKFKSVKFATLLTEIKTFMLVDLPQTTDTDNTVDFMPLATIVDTNSIIIGTRTAYDVYHTIYMRIYMQELSGILARLIFNAQDIREEYSVNVVTYTHDIATIRLLQWFLHNINVNNEGYSQEIVYDLGKVPLIGPVPPAAQEIWEGGYVDYPFTGVGYGNTDESTGFKSPSVDAWVENVKMFWNSEQKVFDGSDNP